ncbi:ribbon-helix-helix protein, CopG family [Candidatus Daviesbacteria bacterium]|nr:ribbon-helix-helix protein, CopG family [Candidatus Daviesbacteria bacterium]
MQTQTFNISLPKELVKKVDRAAKKEYRNRSELIREALRIYMDRMDSWNRIFKAGNKAMKEMGITSEKQVNDIVYEFRHGRKPR